MSPSPYGDLTPGGTRERRRGVDVVSLTAGLVCAVLWFAFAFGDLDSFDEIGRVVWPTVLVGIGGALLFPSGRGGRTHRG